MGEKPTSLKDRLRRSAVTVMVKGVGTDVAPLEEALKLVDNAVKRIEKERERHNDSVDYWHFDVPLSHVRRVLVGEEKP